MIESPLFLTANSTNGRRSSATENSAVRSAGDTRASVWVLEVRDAGSWSGTLKVAARVVGTGSRLGATDFGGYLSITNRLSGAVVAGGTGITAAGIYEVSISGLEARLEHTRVAGTVEVREHVVRS
jgi:hypothetical protein